MKSVRSIPLAIAAALALSTSALAQENDGENRFSQFDTDGDEALSLAEFMAAPVAANADRDGDGAVSLEEYGNTMRRGLPGRVRRGTPRPQAAPASNEDESAESEEQARREARQERFMERLNARFENLDADRDGVVSLDEYRGDVFARLDRDEDGLVQASEWATRGFRARPGGPAGRADQADQADEDTQN